MTGNWPWPNDTKDDRYRRIIDFYRNALMTANPEACLTIDKRLAGYGESWVSDDTIVDVNEMLTAKAICERFGIAEWNVRDWARRHPEQVRKFKGVNGRALFRVGDVLRFAGQNKGRR